MKRILFISIASVIAFASCKKGTESEFKTADNGLTYKIVESNPENQKLKLNDVVIMHLSYSTVNGKTLFDSDNSGRTYMRQVTAPTHPDGSIEDGLMMMHIGDSAEFKINAYDFFKFTLKQSGLPANVKKSDDLIIRVRAEKVLPKKEFNDVLTESYHKDENAEKRVLRTYLRNTGIEVEPNESGLIYVQVKKGTGAQAKAGDMVKVHYTGKLISGEIFDSSIERNKPIEFTLGVGQVIPGWDEGISMMKVGEKAKLIIPSKIAYGPNGIKDVIPPYSTLVFDVELISVN